MKIRWVSEPISGTFHNDPTGVQVGDVVDVPDADALRYVALGYAEPMTKTGEKAAERQERHAQAAVPDNIETTTMGAEVGSPPHQVNKAALAPDAIVHDVTPDKGPVSADNPLVPEHKGKR